MDILIEHIIRKGMYEVAGYFRDLIENERIAGKVPVLVKERPMDTIFFVPCNVQGIPERMYYEFLTFQMPKEAWTEGADISMVPTTSVRRKTVQIEQPIMRQDIAYNYPVEHFYFLWEGRMMEDVELNLADLDVKYLQQLSQEAIKKRESIILDEVIKNKLIK